MIKAGAELVELAGDLEGVDAGEVLAGEAGAELVELAGDLEGVLAGEVLAGEVVNAGEVLAELVEVLARRRRHRHDGRALARPSGRARA